MAEPRGNFSDWTGIPLGTGVLQVIAGAKEESARLQHEYVGTEHVVLALARSGGNGAPLADFGVDPERVYTQVCGVIGRGSAMPNPDADRPLTSRTKRAFSLAADAARELGHADIGVAHLLVGLMRERMNIGAQVLADYGLTEEGALEHARHVGGTGQGP